MGVRSVPRRPPAASDNPPPRVLKAARLVRAARFFPVSAMTAELHTQVRRRRTFAIISHPYIGL
jgi:hypothetical protein